MVYGWVPKEKRTKLDAKSQKKMLTRYSDNHSTYKLVYVKTNTM